MAGKKLFERGRLDKLKYTMDGIVYKFKVAKQDLLFC